MRRLIERPLQFRQNSPACYATSLGNRESPGNSLAEYGVLSLSKIHREDGNCLRIGPFCVYQVPYGINMDSDGCKLSQKRYFLWLDFMAPFLDGSPMFSFPFGILPSPFRVALKTPHKLNCRDWL